jgi:hypothetical protein
MSDPAIATATPEGSMKEEHIVGIMAAILRCSIEAETPADAERDAVHQARRLLSLAATEQRTHGPVLLSPL